MLISLVRDHVLPKVDLNLPALGEIEEQIISAILPHKLDHQSWKVSNTPLPCRVIRELLLVA